MKYHIVTLGCQMNHSDSERVQQVLEAMGYVRCDKEEDAEMIGILACSVRQKAIDKVYSKIAMWNKWKARKNLITFVTGCILPADQVKFLKLFDFVFAMRELPQFPEMMYQYGLATPVALQQSMVASPKEEMKFFWKVKPLYNSAFEAYVPIQNGCDKFCSFCAVPYTRGREVSRPSGEILGEVEHLMKTGYQSITLLGQNVNSYGRDKQGTEITFAALLEQIGELGFRLHNPCWVYFTSPHPRDMDEEVIRVIAKYPVLAKQIHLPIQSGDDKVLIRMNRKHSVAKYRQIVEAIHTHLPQATLFTDIIVGFSGETDEQFEQTRAIVRECGYQMAYIAMYSPRPGATSFTWPDDVPREVKKQRYATLSADLAEVSARSTARLMGQTVEVLVREEDRKPGFLSGHTEGKVVVRFASTNRNLIGKRVLLRITSAQAFSAQGELEESDVAVNPEVQ